MALKVVGFGAGGHAKVVIEMLRTDGRYEIAGLLDNDPALIGKDVLGAPVLGDDTIIKELENKGITNFFVGVGGAGDLSVRRRLFELAVEEGLKPANAVHPQAVVSPSATLGSGVTIMAGAVVNACAVLGENVIINSGAIVEHDCVVSDHVHVGPGACICGGVKVDGGALVGAGSTIRQGLKVGEGAVVGAGSVVVKDVSSNTEVAGVPARHLRNR